MIRYRGIPGIVCEEEYSSVQGATSEISVELVGEWGQLTESLNLPTHALLLAYTGMPNEMSYLGDSSVHNVQGSKLAFYMKARGW